MAPATWLADRSGASIIALAFAGLLAGALILLFEPIADWLGGLVGVEVGRPFTPVERDFLEREQTGLWLLLLAGQTALWAVLLVPICDALSRLPRAASPAVRFTYPAAVLVPLLALLVAAQFRDDEWTLPGQTTKVAILTALAGSVAAIAAAGLGRVLSALEQAESRLDRAVASPPAPPGPQSEASDPEIATYLELRAALDRLLECMGVIVAAAVLASGALRNATITWEQSRGSQLPPDEIFPQEAVLAYGLYFSALLAILALPVYEKLRAGGRRLRDHLAEEILPPAAGWKERNEERAAIAGLLKLEVSAANSLRAGAAILAPLASSLVSRALG